MTAAADTIAPSPDEVAPTPKRRGRGARVVTTLRNLERRLKANGNGHGRALTVPEMVRAVTETTTDPYRDWASAYWEDVRRGWWGGLRSRVSASLLVSTRTPVPRPYRRGKIVSAASDAAPTTTLTILRVGPKREAAA